MSVKMMALVFERYGFEAFDGPIPEDETGAASTAEVLLAQAMADHADDQGNNIYPGLSSLSRKARLSTSSTRRYIKLMVAIGWLLRVKVGVGGRGNTNEYRINPDWVKGVNLKGFAERRKQFEQTGVVTPLEPQYEGSGASENPSTAVTPITDGKGSSLTPFGEKNGSNLNPFTGETLPPVHIKGVTAMTPESSEPKNSDAHAPARRGARTRGAAAEPEREKPTAEQILRTWRARLAAIAASDVSLLLHSRGVSVSRTWPDWPKDLQRIFADAIESVADEAANLEISRGACSPEMRRQADEAAQRAAAGIVTRYMTLEVAA